MPLWDVGERSRGSWSTSAPPVPMGHYCLLAGRSGGHVSHQCACSPWLLLRRLAPVPPEHHVEFEVP